MVNMEYAKSFVLYSILHELSKTLGAEVTDGWSEHLTPICVDGETFAVHISDDAFRADFAARYAASVDEVLRQCFDPPLHLKVWGNAELAHYLAEQITACPFDLKQASAGFSANPGNATACHAARSFAEGTGNGLLYIVGARGSGKTHFLRAAARHIWERSHDTEILIKYGDYFCNEVINARRSGMPELLRNNFESEVLLIDDVQFAVLTDYTTETLLSCLWKRLCDGKRTMMTSVKEPASLSRELAELIQKEGTLVYLDPLPASESR